MIIKVMSQLYASATDTVGRNGNLHPKITTRGWKLLCEWKDGSTEWIALKDIKDSYPLEMQSTQWLIEFRKSQHSNGG